MSYLRSLFRYCGANKKLIRVYVKSRTIFTSSSYFDEENDNEKDDENKNKKNTEKKLNELLKVMLKTKPAPNVTLPKPRERAQKQAREDIATREKEIQEWDNLKLGNKLSEAASNVAKTLGGDTEKTEMELLDIYFRSKKSEPSEKSTEDRPRTSVNLNELLFSMEVDRQVPEENTRAFQIKALTPSINRRPIPKMPLSRKRTGVSEKINILGATPLDIFTTDISVDIDKPTVADCVVWNYLEQRDIQLSVTHPPNNIFEQLITWTEQGKIWKFPIDNEQDFKEEENVDFSEHVFLDHLIEPWCPNSGPIKNFMELVCVGLSKNPYLTVSEKKAHIYYYEHYFKGKNKLLEELELEPIKERELESDQQEVTA